MYVDDPAFGDLARRYAIDNELVAEFNKAEQIWLNGLPDGFTTSTDVVRKAWQQLGPGEQAKAMDTLFNAFYHQTVAVRKWLELQDKEPDSNTYLLPGDLEVIDDTLSGAVAMQTMGVVEEGLDEVFPDGMLPIHIDLLQRLISELELLQHRLKMRGAERQP